jgi:hypothetical protein
MVFILTSDIGERIRPWLAYLTLYLLLVSCAGADKMTNLLLAFDDRSKIPQSLLRMEVCSLVSAALISPSLSPPSPPRPGSGEESFR